MVTLARVVPECPGLTLTAEGRVQIAPGREAWPVVCVTWHGAREYCRAQGKRLPLDAEWELMARGEEGRPFPWGREMPQRGAVAFDLENSLEPHPRPIGASSQDRTPLGIHDLAGNVAEWVDDDNGDKDEERLRGGSWATLGPCGLLGSRCRLWPADSNDADVGFRCARDVLRGDPGRAQTRPGEVR
jgi:formylglycine-generating enzyme required for sulfatase activity